MTTVYKRPEEEDSFECHRCKTVWRDSWISELDRGWCPACREANIPDNIIKLPIPKKLTK